MTGGVFTDGEWERFYGEVLAKKSDGIEEKTAKFQEGCVAGTANTKALTAQLSDEVQSGKSKIVITTIQTANMEMNGCRPTSQSIAA